jgi:hypothetical protein
MAEPAVDGREEAVVGMLGPGAAAEETRRGVREERWRPCQVDGWLPRGGFVDVGDPGGELSVGELTWPTRPY